VSQPTLHTERLVLRPLTPQDAPAVQRLAGHRDIASTTLNIPHPYEDGLAEMWIETLSPQYEAGAQATYGVTLAETGEVVGAVGLIIRAEHGRAELGYWIGVPYWGRGYATEAARALIEFGFDYLALGRIHASYLARNPASGHVMRKLGMRYEGFLRKHVRKWEVEEDLVVYGILQEEWHGGPDAGTGPGAPADAELPPHP
jgi:[ribosomal protein S5]-alanine N-acetyltransferase